MTIADSEPRFEFGKNWADFSSLIDETRIRQAETKLAELLGTRSLHGRRFLDIGCGSGIHSLAALRLGASTVVAVDLDAKSVATTKEVLRRFWQDANYTVLCQDVFNLEPKGTGTFDVVYSWGVLHHTGDLRRAILCTLPLVSPGGTLALGIYGRTRFCGVWKKIKRWYSGTTPERQARAERLYISLFAAYLLLRGKRLSTHLADYEKKRGMNFQHDVRDWIGGYPYESASPDELRSLIEPQGFELRRANVRRRSGLFGSGNDEYVFVKSGPKAISA